MACFELAADGRSNREIAEELMMSVRTFERRLSSSYRKLDVSSRVALARALAARPAAASPRVAATARLDATARADARHLATVFIPAEETCLSLFESDGPGPVGEANDRAGFSFDRITEVAVMGGVPHPS